MLLFKDMLTLVRFQPVFTPTAVCLQRYFHFISIFHFFNDNLLYFLFFGWHYAEIEFVMYL